MPEAARAIDRAEHRHHDRECTDGLKTVGMRGETAHRVKGDGIAGHRLVMHAPTVGPRNRKLDRLVAGRDAQFVRQSANRGGGYASDVLGPFGRVIANALDEKLKRRLHRFSVGKPELACEIRIGAACMVQHRRVADAIPPQFIVREMGAAVTGIFARAHGNAELRTVGLDVDQITGVRIAREKAPVVEAGVDQFMRDREQQRTICTRTDGHPLVGNRGIARAHGVDRDEAAAAALELRDRDLQRIGVMVLRGPDHHEHLRTIEVGSAEFPERSADRVDHSRGHVHRAEPAVGSVVGRAELPRKEPGERLHLVASGEERELLRISRADVREALGDERIRLVPCDRLELGLPALGVRLAAERQREPRRRVLLHDARCALRADHAPVDRVLGIAVDVTDFAAAQVHAYAAAARAHVARGLPDFGRLFGRGLGGGDHRRAHLNAAAL